MRPSPAAPGEGLLQFTPGYFSFHARRTGVSSRPFWVLFLALASVVVLGWCTLMAGVIIDLVVG